MSFLFSFGSNKSIENLSKPQNMNIQSESKNTIWQEFNLSDISWTIDHIKNYHSIHAQLLKTLDTIGNYSK